MSRRDPEITLSQILSHAREAVEPETKKDVRSALIKGRALFGFQVEIVGKRDWSAARYAGDARHPLARSFRT